jgi:hypothetical protein
MEEKILQLEGKIHELETHVRIQNRQLERIAIAVDEVRRRTGLSSTIDDQSLLINSRSQERAM